MQRKNTLDERRQDDRFKIDGKAIAYYRTHSPKVAEIVDIGRGGLSLSYVGSAELPDSCFELEIVFPDRTDYVDGLPCQAVSDSEIDPGTGTRRCCVRFGELTNHQRDKIQSLIENFCWRAVK